MPCTGVAEHWAGVLDIAGWVVGIGGFIWGTIVIHEYGHLLVGRLVGLPRGAARVVIGARPPHVALRTPEGWIGPDDHRYVHAFTRYRDSAVAGWLFAAGGLLIETLAVLAGGTLLTLAGLPSVAAAWLAVSTLLILLYLAADFASCRRANAPAGDYAALWELSAVATTLFVAGILASRMTALSACFYEG